MPTDRALREAVAALAEVARARLVHHPAGHALRGRGHHLDLALRLPLDEAEAGLEGAADSLSEDLSGELESLLAHHAAFRPGRIYCLRCRSADCDDAAPTDSRHVFAGYGPTGLPRFLELGQWLLERRHPRVQSLFGSSRELLTDIASGRELAADLLPAFRDADHDIRIHGQVAAGWFQLQPRQGPPAKMAITVQVLSSARRKGKGRRLGLNVLGTGPSGESLAELYDQLDTLPWIPVVRWGERVLRSIEGAQHGKKATPEALSARLEGMLAGMARRLEQTRRAHERRTRHGRDRHRGGDRPTRMALADLERASRDDFFVDTRHDTLVVVGDRGRAHVWSRDGKLVTSLRVSPESLVKRQRQEIWRPASSEEVTSFRERMG